MAYNPNDYNGITSASEEIAYYERMEALADARDEQRNAELAAEALECAENDEAEEHELIPIGDPVRDAAYGWARAMGLQEAA